MAMLPQLLGTDLMMDILRRSKRPINCAHHHANPRRSGNITELDRRNGDDVSSWRPVSGDVAAMVQHSKAATIRLLGHEVWAAETKGRRFS
jgi:hypothetical protein